MSTSGPPALTEDVVAARVGAIERESRAVAAGLARSRGFRMVLLVAFALFTGVSLTAYYRLATRFQEKEQLDALLKKAEQRLSERSGFLMGEVQKLVDNSAPKISTAFVE